MRWHLKWPRRPHRHRYHREQAWMTLICCRPDEYVRYRCHCGDELYWPVNRSWPPRHGDTTACDWNGHRDDCWMIAGKQPPDWWRYQYGGPSR